MPSMKEVRAIFLGSKQFGLQIFDILRRAKPNVLWTAITLSDEADPRSDLENWRLYCANADIALTVVSKPAEAYNVICEKKPHIGFVCGWYWIIKPGLIANFKDGLWGIHNSALPFYRGGSPVVWALINGERQIGSSMFRLGEGMDDGLIALQVHLAISPEDNVATVVNRLQAAFADALPSTWMALLDGTAQLREQDHSKATYCGLRIADDGLINWNWPAERVHDFVRAQTRPYPGAFSYCGNERITFWATELHEGRYDGTPGQVLANGQESVLIACGERSALRVLAATKGECSELTKIFSSIRLRLGVKSTGY